MRKLEEIIREFYIEDLGLSQIDNRFPRFLQIAATGLQELNHDLKSVVTEVVLEVNDNDTVDLPNNYIDYTLIGIVRGGVVESLGLNKNLAPKTKDSCGNLESFDINPDNSGNSGYLHNTSHYTEDGQFNGRAFGIGGGGNSNGQYKVFKDRGYIALTGAAGDEIVLRYLASVEQVDGNFMVEEYLVDAIKSFIWHRYMRRMRSYGITEKAEAEREFNRKKKLAMKRVNRFNLPEFMNAFRTGYRSSPNI